LALRNKCLKYFQEIAELAGYDSLADKRVCLLGSQYVVEGGKRYRAANYFKARSMVPIAIDWNGSGGALPYNLNNRIVDDPLMGSFDFVIDGGTSEHVEKQYTLFINIFNLLKIGGVVIHIVPYVDSWIGHGYWKYSFDFFESVRKEFCYRLLDSRLMSNQYGRFNKSKGCSSLLLYVSFVKEFVLPSNFMYFISPTFDQTGAENEKRQCISKKDS